MSSSGTIVVSLLLALATGAVNGAAHVSSVVPPDGYVHSSSEQPAQASSTVTSAFSARVSALNHGLAQITVVGTGQPGELITITGSSSEPVSSRVKVDGSWRAVVRGKSGSNDLVVRAALGEQAHLHAELLILRPPLLLGEVDSLTRSVSLIGEDYYPGSKIVLEINGFALPDVPRADSNGRWAFQLTSLPFGPLHVTAAQRFDGAINGGADGIYNLNGAPTILTSQVDMRSGRISLHGTAPSGTTVRIIDDSGTITPIGTDNPSIPVTGMAWDTELSIPRNPPRLYSLTVQTLLGGQVVGEARHVTLIPSLITASVHKQTTKKVVLVGTGEPGAVIAFTDGAGKAISDRDGSPVIATVSADGTWQRTLDRVLIDGVVVNLHAAKADAWLGDATITLAH